MAIDDASTRSLTVLKVKCVELSPNFARCSTVYRHAVIFLHPDCMVQNNVKIGSCVLVSSSNKAHACLAFPINSSKVALSVNQCGVAHRSTFSTSGEVSITGSCMLSAAKSIVLRTEPKLLEDKARMIESAAATTLSGLPVIVGQEINLDITGQRVRVTVEAIGSTAPDAGEKNAILSNGNSVTDSFNSLTIHEEPTEDIADTPVNDLSRDCKNYPQFVRQEVCIIDSKTRFSVSNPKPAAASGFSPMQSSSNALSETPSTSSAAHQMSVGKNSHLSHAAAAPEFAGYHTQQSFCLDLLRHAYISSSLVNMVSSDCSVTPIKSKRKSFAQMSKPPQTPAQNSTAFSVCSHARSVLVYGVAGVGKSMFVQHILTIFRASLASSASKLAVLNVPPLSITPSASTIGVTKLQPTTGDDIERSTTIQAIEQNLAEDKQSFLIVTIDELDLLPFSKANTSGETISDRKAYAALCSLLDFVHRSTNDVFVIATVRSADSLPISLRRVGRFDVELEIPPPSTADRVALLSTLLNFDGAEKQQHIAADQLDSLCRTLHGYVYCDLQSLVMHATRLAASSSRIGAAGDSKNFINGTSTTQFPVSPGIEHLYSAMRCVRPSAMREIIIDVPHTRWDDIGGYAKVKKCMRQSVEWAVHDQPERFRLYGITPPRGVLLFGPPGCSKTLMAKAIACEAGLNFLVIKGPELFNKYVGESERAVREVFRRARFASPSCIFIDEIDALGGERGGAGSSRVAAGGGGGQSVSDRMLTTLLNELDGVEDLKQVVVIAATNRPDVIDKALLRPGRLDRIIYVPLPDAASRKEILSGRITRMPVVAELLIDELVEKTDGYSGAELVAVCQEAGMIALESLQEFSSGEAVPKVTMEQFLSALKRVKPRTKADTVRFYDKWAEEMAFGGE